MTPSFPSVATDLALTLNDVAVVDPGLATPLIVILPVLTVTPEHGAEIGGATTGFGNISGCATGGAGAGAGVFGNSVCRTRPRKVVFAGALLIVILVRD